MKRINCTRCGARNAMHEDGALLENGGIDIAWSCDMCGHVDYGEVELAKSRREADMQYADNSGRRRRSIEPTHRHGVFKAS